MHDVVYYVALVWTALLISGAAVLVVRSRLALERILALDTMVLTVVAFLLVLSGGQESATYVDAAVVLVLLSFGATIAAVRYHAGREPFG